MKIPSTIKVGPYVYNVAYESDVRGDDTARLAGDVSHNHLRIRIDKDMAPVVQFETFIHETIHAIGVVSGVDLKEREVHALSMVLTQVIIDNGIAFPAPKPAEAQE